MNTLKLEYGQTPKVLLIGNGINRAFDYASWDDLIKSISTKDLSENEKLCMSNVPYPLQPVILTNDHLDTRMKEISQPLSVLRASKDEEVLLRQFASLPVDAILTTNYTYELESALDNTFKCIPGRKCKARYKAYDEGGEYVTRQLHTYFRSIEEKPPIWHIHGEAARHDTMILGHYYYGKLLSKMQQYVSSLIARAKANNAREQDLKIRSWMDYFMLGDVYIVGLGMALSEMDLWWLVNCKKRHFPETNVILYKPDIKLEEMLLAEAYGIKVETDGLVNNDYKAYYEWVYRELTQKL